MGLVLRRADDPSFEVTLGDKLLSLGSDAACDVRLAGPGIAGMHLRISAVAIEALVAVTVGGIRLGAGRSRRCVPSRLRVGEASFTIESVGESSVATRELVLRALAVGADLGPRIVVVEGPSSGRDAPEREAGGELASRSDAPSESPEGATTELDAKVLRPERCTVPAFARVELPDLRARSDRDAEVQAVHPDRVSELAGGAICRVDEHHVAGDLVFDGA